MTVDHAQLFIVFEADEGTVVSIEICKLDSFGELKVEIERKTGVPSDSLVLFYNGHKLQDAYIIKDLKAEQGAKITYIDKRKRSVLTI